MLAYKATEEIWLPLRRCEHLGGELALDCGIRELTRDPIVRLAGIDHARLVLGIAAPTVLRRLARTAACAKSALGPY